MRRVLAAAAIGAALWLTSGTAAGAATFAPPAPLDLGQVAVGSTGAPVTVHIIGADTPRGQLTVGGVAVASGSPFAITATTCNGAAVTSCTVTLTFTPAGAGAATGALTGTETTPATGAQTPFSYGLQGTGLAPPPVLGEAPSPFLLPGAALVLFGAGALVLRRRAPRERA